MGKFLTVFKYHLNENVRAKSFSIVSLILFALVLGVFAYGHFVGNDKKVDIHIVNETSSYKVNVKKMNENQDFATFKEIHKSKLAKSKKQTKESELDGVIVIDEKQGVPKVEYLFKRMPDYEVVAYIQHLMQPQYLKQVVHEKNVSPEVASALLAKVDVKEVQLKKTESLGLVYFFIMLIYTFIMVHGQGVAMGVSGEKASRVMEIMITKVKPFTMMMAKIAATLVTGLVQIFVLGIAYGVAVYLGWTNGEELNVFGMPLDLSVLQPSLFIYFVVYFVLGFILYAFLFAALGSLTNRIEDLGSVMAPVMILIVGSFFLGFKTMSDPNAPLVMFGTYFPFSSPIVAFSRIVMGEATGSEIAMSLGIIVATIAVVGTISSKVYVKGVMKYNEKAKFTDLFRLLKK